MSAAHCQTWNSTDSLVRKGSLVSDRFATQVTKLRAILPEEVMKILEVTDSLNLHRESVFIPLATEKTSSVTVQPDGRLRIACPGTGSFEEWLVELRRQLEKIDLSRLRAH
jgi:hypothetical protein